MRRAVQEARDGADPGAVPVAYLAADQVGGPHGVVVDGELGPRERQHGAAQRLRTLAVLDTGEGDEVAVAVRVAGTRDEPTTVPGRVPGAGREVVAEVRVREHVDLTSEPEGLADDADRDLVLHCCPP